MAPQNLNQIINNYRTSLVANQEIDSDKLITDIIIVLKSDNTFKSLNSHQIHSIAERITATIISIEPYRNNFYNATRKKGVCNILTQQPTTSYTILPYENVLNHICNFNVGHSKISLSYDFDADIIYVLVTTTKQQGTQTYPSVQLYALADKNDIVQKTYQKPIYPNINETENAITCSRFDPSKTAKNEHENKFDNLILDPEEEKLYKQYFEEKSYCPHFHVFIPSLCEDAKCNDKSLAININNLRNYIRDLNSASSTDSNNPIMKYNLAMPYLDMAKGNLVIPDTDPFLQKTKQLLDLYCNSDKKVKAIEQIYKHIEEASREKQCIGAKKLNTLKDLERAFNIMAECCEVFPANYQVALADIMITTELTITYSSSNMPQSKFKRNKNNNNDDEQNPEREQ